MSLAGNMKDKNIYKGFEAIKVKKSKLYNLADEIPNCGSENLSQIRDGKESRTALEGATREQERALREYGRVTRE